MDDQNGAPSADADVGSLCLVSQVTAADTRAIEAGLHELWRLAESGEIMGALARAASMTLLVTAGDGTVADAAIPILDDLADAHPHRAILLVSDEGTDRPRARLAGHVRRAEDGEPGRYWEEIRLVSPARSLHQVMGAVASLTLPNLPVQNWWTREPRFDGDLYTYAVEVSDRILVDSSRFADPTRSLPRMEEAVAAAHGTVAFADLSWTRLTPWRTLIAEFFDPPAHLALLDSIERVALEYVVKEGGEVAQALLLLGWLASRLGWEPRAAQAAGAGDWELRLVDGVRPVRFEVLRREGSDGTDGRVQGLHAVTIEAVEQGRRGSYRIERRGDDQEAQTVTDVDGARLEGRAGLPVRREVELLREELGRFATDAVYRQSLELVSRAFRPE